MLAFVWLVPLAGGILLWALGPQLRTWAGPIGSALIGAAFLATCALWGSATAPGGLHVPLVSWLGGWNFGLQLDRLSLVWSLIITGVGFLITSTRSDTWTAIVPSRASSRT